MKFTPRRGEFHAVVRYCCAKSARRGRILHRVDVGIDPYERLMLIQINYNFNPDSERKIHMKKLLSLLLVFSLLLSLAACGSPETDPTGGQTQTQAQLPDSGERMFTDDLGRNVFLPEKIERIVPSGPLAQIILYAIAPDMFVGLAAEWDDCARGIVPDAYWDLPYFGQLYNTANLNVEELALADPQLIIDIGQSMSSGTEDMDTLQSQTGIPTVFISASLQDMPETFRKLGKLLDREEKAEALAAFCERVYSRTISIMEEVGDSKVDALYVIGEQGLNVLARDSYHSELIDMLTNNLAVVDTPSSKGSGNEVTLEQIALWNPDFILFTPDSIYDDVAQRDTWCDISAIASGNYIKVPQGPHNWMGTPPAVQRYLGMIWLTAELYHDYCDYDAKAEILEYYRLFYGCELTEEQYQTLTADAMLE